MGDKLTLISAVLYAVHIVLVSKLAAAHAGEFYRLLKELSPDEEKLYAAGAEEVEEEIAKRKGK